MPDSDDSAIREQIAVLRKQADDLRKRGNDILARARVIDESADHLESALASEATLTNVRPDVKPFDMAKSSAARKRISLGRFRSEGSADTEVAKGLERVGWSYEDLAKAIAAHPTIRGHVMGGYKKQQLAAAAKRAKKGQRQVPIRKIVAEAAQAVTTRDAVEADPSRGIEKQPAYDGIPLSAWGRVIG